MAARRFSSACLCDAPSVNGGDVNQRVFDIIPACKQTICDKNDLFLRYLSDSTKAERRELQLSHDSKVIGFIPGHFGGKFAGLIFKTVLRDKATVFDFVNVFTEYAKECAPALKLEIEERSGSLAKYIAENAKKF